MHSNDNNKIKHTDIVKKVLAGFIIHKILG